MLRNCVVRIDGDGEFRGTGFFVAPGEVLTCAHVVHGAGSLTAAGAGWTSLATVESIAPSLAADSPETNFYPLPDIALLHISAAPESHPCVRLENAAPVSGSDADILYLYGYSQGEYAPSEVNPSPAAVEYKGPLGEGRRGLLKLGGDQVLRGYSGCPALNLRTGAVCGVIDSTRDAGGALGGFAISVGLVDEALPGLLARNLVQHESDDRWKAAEEQERLAARKRGSPEVLPLRRPLTKLEGDQDFPQSELLQPRYGVVGLLGRQPLLDKLMQWRESDHRIRVMVVTGGGGFGKTRLALEVCEQARRAGWTAGLFTLDSAADVDREIRRLVDWPARLCVAIDYAETRPLVVAPLLLRLLRAEDRPPVRLILVCRQTQTKRELEELFTTSGDGHEEVARLLGGADPVQLDRYEIDRRGLFEAGVAAFAERLGKQVDRVARPSLQEDHFSRVLFVLAAALLVTQDPEIDIDSMGQEQLMVELIDRHEAQYWERLNQSLGTGLDPGIQRAAVAAGTVLGADSEEEALSLIRIVPGLEDATAERHRTVARWLSRLYGSGRLDGQGVLGPMEPDMLAEALVSDVYTSNPQLLGATLEAATEAQLVRALSVLSRASDGSEELRELFRVALDERLPDLLKRALAGKSDLATGLDLAVSLLKPLAGAAETMRHHPGGGQIHRPLLASLSLLAVEHYRDLAESGEDRHVSELALALVALADRLDDLGRTEETIEILQQAVAYYRQLVESEGDRYELELAMALNELSIPLDKMSQGEQALPVIEEAVKIYRGLMEREPGKYRPQFASSLNNLAIVLGNRGRDEDAVNAIEEAVEHWRALVDLDRATFLPDLARSLNNLANRVGDNGDGDGALDLIEEVVELRRGLAEQDRELHLPDLTTSLGSLGHWLTETGQAKEALPVIEEATEHWRALVAIDRGYLADLAGSLNNLSIVLDRVKQRDAALLAVEEALAHWRELVQLYPGQFRPELASVLNNFSNRLHLAGRSEEALVVIEEAVEHYRALVEQDSARHLPDLATALMNLSNRLAHDGDTREALAAIEEAVELRRLLARQSPDRYLQDLAAGQNALARRLAGENRLPEAIDTIEEAVTQYRALVELDSRRLPRLADSLVNLSNLRGEAGDHLGAVEPIEEAVEHYRALVEQDPERHLSALAGSVNNLSNRLRQTGRLDEALEAIEEAVEHRRALVEQDPGLYLADLAGSLGNLSLVLTSLGRAGDARREIEAGLEEYKDTVAARILLLTLARLVEGEDLARAIALAWESMEQSREAGEGTRASQARMFLRSIRVERGQSAFDKSWGEAIEDSCPPWLVHFREDEGLLDLLSEWLRTPDWEASQKFLETHEEDLRSDQARALLEQLQDQTPGEFEFQRHLLLLREVDRKGVAAVYATLREAIARVELQSRLKEWFGRTGEQSLRFLRDHSSELLTPIAEEEVLAAALSHPDVSVLYGPVGILALARLDGPESAFAQAAKPTVVADDADCLAAAADPRSLAQARLRSGSDDQDPEGQFHHALAAAAAGHPEEANQAVRRCRRLLPAWELPGYMRRLDTLADEHPALAEPLCILKQALSTEPGSS